MLSKDDFFPIIVFSNMSKIICWSYQPIYSWAGDHRRSELGPNSVNDFAFRLLTRQFFLICLNAVTSVNEINSCSCKLFLGYQHWRQFWIKIKEASGWVTPQITTMRYHDNNFPQTNIQTVGWKSFGKTKSPNVTGSCLSDCSPKKDC